MELKISYPILFTFFPFLLVLLHTLIKRSNYNKSIKNLPTGPWKLPVIGNMHQLIGSLPHHALRNLANKYGPIMHLQLGEISNIVVSSPEIALEVMKTHDIIFANKPSFLAAKIILYDNTDIATASYGSYWRQLRKICTLELLTSKRVQSFRFIREEEASTLVHSIRASKGSIINLSEKISSVTSTIVARAAFGKKSRDQEAFISILKELFGLMGGFALADLYPSIKLLQVLTGIKAKLERFHKVCDRILENIIRDHKEKKKISHSEQEEDLVDVLLRTQQGNELDFPLTLDNVKAVILDIFIAGTDTLSTTIEWAMSELVSNPRAMEKAKAEIRSVFDGKGYVDETELHKLKYLKLVVKETLRLHPPIVLLACENSERCVINGYEVPAKTKTIVNAWAIGRDPKYWSEADKFQPKRFIDNTIDFKGTNFEYIPFGAGRRICPGITYAMPNVELLLANLVYHFDWKLPNGIRHEDVDMTESFGIVVKRKNDLCLIPIPYCP